MICAIMLSRSFEQLAIIHSFQASSSGWVPFDIAKIIRKISKKCLHIDKYVVLYNCNKEMAQQEGENNGERRIGKNHSCKIDRMA